MGIGFPSIERSKQKPLHKNFVTKMGNLIGANVARKKKTLKPQEIAALSEKTNFAEDEIVAWHAGFRKDCPTGKLTLFEFSKIYAQFFPLGNPEKFASFVFNVFDVDGDKSIGFEEFLQSLSITANGSLDQKLDWAFKLYDLDGDGSITKDEMLEIVTAISEMVGSQANADTPEKRVEHIFAVMDEDNNGSLSKEEFIEGAKKDQSLVQALSLY